MVPEARYGGDHDATNKRAYAISIRLRREGAATYLEVLQAQTALLQTRADALVVRLDAARLRAEIDALLDPSF